MTDMQSILESIEQHRKVLSEVGEANKAVLFDALAAAGITDVTVEFDGEGDSGQIESVIACKGDAHVPLPGQTVTLQSASWDGKEVSLQEMAFHEAIERLCYDYLEQEQGGWENNDGAFGDFKLSVASRTVELEFNGRYSDVHTSAYTF
jgi:hypothetical protein